MKPQMLAPASCCSLVQWSQEIQQDLELAAGTDVPVLISAAAADVAKPIAMWIHAHSARRVAKLEVVDPLLTRPRQEWWLLAGGGSRSARARLGAQSPGTILVTRVDELSVLMQQSLFRFLEVRDASGHRPHRVIAAMAGSALASVRAGRFREDLFYRLNGIHIACLPREVLADPTPATLTTPTLPPGA